MARLQGSMEIDQNSFDAADQLLAKLDIAIRGKSVKDGMRKVGNEIRNKTKSILPKPGYPGDKPGMKPLRETIKVKVKEYESGDVIVMITGYSYSNTRGEGGNHGHLLEGGHDIVKGGSKKKGGNVIGHVPPHEYMIKVVESSKQEQQSTFLATIKKALKVS